MIRKPNIIRSIPCEGIPYEGHIIHVISGKTTGRLVVTVLTTDKNLASGYQADFCETAPDRVQNLLERILRNCNGRATGLNETLLNQPVILKRVRGRLQIHASKQDMGDHVGVEFADEEYSPELLEMYPFFDLE